MKEGVLTNQDAAIADFIVNNGYEPYDVIPMCCVPSGHVTYGLKKQQDHREYLGVHLMDTWYCLEHPDFRPRAQVIRKRFSEDLSELSNEDNVALDSFEVWKFLTLFFKGSAVAYDLLYLPAIHMAEGAESLFSLMRQGVTNRIGKTARAYALHNWTKNKNSPRTTVTAYYRLMQAILFLREDEFEWEADSLLDYMSQSDLMPVGDTLLRQYQAEDIHTLPIDVIGNELRRLIDEVDRAGIVTKLPDRVPKQVQEAILAKVRQSRSQLI